MVKIPDPPHRIPLDAIALGDETYRIRTDTTIDLLKESIKVFGLLHAPILFEKESSQYGILCGFRRVMAAKTLAMPSIYARILPAAPDTPSTQELKRAQLAISENSCLAPLNLVEQSRSLTLLKTMCPDQKQFDELDFGALGLPDNPQMIQKLLAIAKLPYNIQQGLINHTLSLGVALALLPFEDTVKEKLYLFFIKLRLNLNKQREFLTLVNEIAIREEIPVAKVLCGPEMTGIIDDDNLTPAQKQESIRFYLKKRRYPALTSAEMKFETNLRALKLPPNIRLKPPKFFEGTTYALTLTFQNIDDLEKQCHVLQKRLDHPQMVDILERPVDND